MTKHEKHTVLLTGANSGVGLEAAAQFAEAGWGRVILACRTEAKAEAARAQLVARTGKDPFEVLAVDTCEFASANTAADEVRRRGVVVDLLVLNAGASGTEARFNRDGIEVTWASTLVGHHVLTMRLVADGGLAPAAHIIIAGSEGARGNLPGMKVHDIEALASEHFGGDRVAAIDALARVKGPVKFANMNEYVTAKRVVAWWASALARRLPEGMTVNAVSPGSAPASGFARDAGVMMGIMLQMMGMAGSLKNAARRYLDVAEIDSEHSGEFYATAHRKKLVGAMGVQRWPAVLEDRSSQEAGFDAVVRMTGTPYPEQAGAAPPQG